MKTRKVHRGIIYGDDFDKLSASLKENNLYADMERFNDHITCRYYSDPERTRLVDTLEYDIVNGELIPSKKSSEGS